MRTAIEFCGHLCFIVAILVAVFPFFLMVWVGLKEEMGIRYAMKINRKGKQQWHQSNLKSTDKQ